LSWQANESNNVETWVEWDRYDIIGRGADAVTPIEATVTEDAPELVWNAAWRSTLSQDTIFSLTYGGYDGYYYLDPASGYDVAGRYDGHTGLYSVNSPWFYLADRTRNQVNASLSHYADDFIKGEHDFKFGMEIERSTVRSRYGYTTGAWFYDNYGYFYDDPGTAEYDGGYYTLGYYNYAYDLTATINRGSLFAQDSWKISPHFTLNAGLRAEINKGSVPGEGTIFDNTAFAPRLGFAWDATKDGKTVIKAHYGRFFEKFVATQFYFAKAGSFTPLEQRIIYPSGFVESLGQARAGVTVIDDDLDQPYLDQMTVGVDREIPGGITLSGTLIYRKKEDFIETVSRDGIFIPVTGTVRETGQTITLFDYMNPETDVLVYQNVPELFREYKGVMLTATKRLRENWQMLASYVYSETTGNVDNLGTSSVYGGDNPSRFLDTPNSLVNAEGTLTHDQTHQVKLQGTYVIPAINLSLSGNYTYYSGDTYMLRSNCLLVDGECYDFNQGSLRFFGEPRGVRRLDPKNELDFRAEWYYDLANQSRLGLFLDVFNVTNQARATVVEDRAGSAFETARSANLPRSYRVGIRVNF
jgi:outer membrane receptor protein involved in Fe transport